MNLPEFSVNRKILVNMIFLILVVLGVGLYRGMPREFFPNANLNEALVMVVYPGASAREVELQITNKIEEAVAEVDGIDDVTSISQQSIAVVDLMIEEGIDQDKFMLDLQAAVNNIGDLPEDAEDPTYLQLDASVVQPVGFVAIGGDVDEAVLLEVAEDVKKEIMDVRGVKKVDVDGIRETEVHVDVDPDLLDHYHTSLGEIIAALGAHNLDLPGGYSELGKREYSLRVLGKYRTLDEIAATVLARGGPESTLRLSQVATVTMAPEERRSSNWLNGDRAGNLTVYKKVDGNAISIMEKVHAIVARYNETLPIPVHMEVRNDSSELIKERLGIMTENAWLTGILVGLVLFFFLGWTNAVLVLIGIPFTFLAGFLFMSVAGMSINMLTLFALIMALGMIVDDAIVVVDNIQRHLELGFPPRMAVIRGTQEVMGPVISAVLTTVAGFLPLLLMTGMIGKFMSAIPKTVSFALLASLIEAILILPSHSFELNSWYGAIRRRLGLKRKIAADGEAIDPVLTGEMERKAIVRALAASEPAERQDADGLRGGYKVKPKNRLQRVLERVYRRQLVFTLRHRYWAVVSVILLAVLAAGLLKKVPVEMFAAEDFDAITLFFELPAGTPLADTERRATQVEAIVREVVKPEELKGIVSSVGYQIVNYQYIRGAQRAELDLDLVSAADRDRSDTQLMALLRERLSREPGFVNLTLERPQSGPPTGKPVEIHVLGPRFEVLEELGAQVRGALEGVSGVVDVADDFDRSNLEYLVEVDEDRCAAQGLSSGTVARTLSAAFQGFTATTFTDPDGEDRDVVVRLAAPYQADLGTLERLTVPSPRGLVPVTALADFRKDRNFTVIRHFDRERAITITADVAGGQTSTAVNKIVQARFGNFALDHPGYRLDFGGEFERTAESFRSLFLLVPVALLAIFMILATQFNSVIQPFIVLFTVPFSFIGVVIGLLVMGYHFTIPAMTGIISLMGLVVNNSLVMVDFINKSRLRGVGRWFSIARSGVTRMRPILLTTVTTIVGLSSLTVASTGASKIMVPMAVSMIWGLAFATVLTLFLIPALVGIVDDIGLRFRTGKSYRQFGPGR